MPYTPPSQRSPAASNGTSPTITRSHSYQGSPQDAQAAFAGPRPALPRSTSSSAYLHKHRRGPSFSESPVSPAGQEGVYTYNGDLKGSSPDDENKLDIHGSLRQSPPPVNKSTIPTGAMISPPDSSHNSSDDEEGLRGRSRKIENLEELQAAIQQIKQRRDPSPTTSAKEVQERLGLQVSPEASQLIKSFSADDLSRQLARPPLSKEARKISHSRSSTDSHILRDGSFSVESPLEAGQDSDADDDDPEYQAKPPMVRKKSGELVRPALRPASAKRRPSSMPGTPTYSKAVHFDSHLEHVRHFLQVDKPLAVSAGSSPAENYESEIEFPFGFEENSRPSRGPTYEWEIKLSNFPIRPEERRHLPIRVERVFLSADNKNLIGQVAVQNLAFHKSVTARFTFDYWKTTSEVAAEFNNDVRRRQNADGCDRFNFTIRLTDIGNLENKTLFFCLRYSVNGREFWDNNGSINYQVDFTKKSKAMVQSGSSPMQALGSRPIGGLPRSRPSPTVPDVQPKTASDSFDDFSTGFDAMILGTSPDSLIGDPQLKLRNPRPRAQIVPDAPTRRARPTSAQAFGTRYDFGASLNAAMQSASSILGSQSGLAPKQGPKAARVVVTPPEEAAANSSRDGPLGSKPDAILSQKPSHQSQSYRELVDKYCFFGSAKSSPQLTKSTLSLVDGASDQVSETSNLSTRSSSPVQIVTQPPTIHLERRNTDSSSHGSRGSSPLPRNPSSGYGSRMSAPMSFGYPYHTSKSNNFFESPVEFAIKG